jgi:DNA-binding NarL/FixJ family response regulator
VSGERVIRLTPREREVLECLAEGLTKAQVATRLHIKEATVGHYIGNINAALHTRTAREAGQVALRLNVVASPTPDSAPD